MLMLMLLCIHVRPLWHSHRTIWNCGKNKTNGEEVYTPVGRNRGEVKRKKKRKEKKRKKGEKKKRKKREKGRREIYTKKDA